MSSPDIYDLVSQLSSTKVRDRNEALLELEQVTDSHKFNNKELNALCSGLFAFIDHEKFTYLKNETSATLSRLQSGNYLLRRLISKRASKLKPSMMLATIEFVTTRFFDPKGHVFDPLALDMSRVLHALVSQDGHRNHIPNELWCSFVEFLIKVLNLQLRANSSEKYLIEILGSLKQLLKDSPISFSKVSKKLSSSLCHYFQYLEKESSITQDLLEISNRSLILFSTSDIYAGVELVKSVVKAARILVDTKYDTTKDHLLVFSILSSEYINSDIRKLISEEGDLVSAFDSEFRANLIRWIDLAIQTQIFNPVDLLDINMIQFKNMFATATTWFDFGTANVKHGFSTRPWLKIFGLSCLLNSLYKVERDSNSQTFKRRRLEQASFSGILSQSESAISTIIELISHNDKSVQILGFKILVFHLNNFTVNKMDLSFDQILLYDKQYLSPWVSLVFKTMLEYGWDPPTDTLCQVLKVNIQMLMDSSSVSVASQTIIEILNSPNFLPNDRALNQLVESVFENAEINGPAVLNDDSLKFWVSFSHLGKVFKFGKKSSGDKIISWMISKWDTIALHESVDVFPRFVAWLAGSDFCYEDKEVKIDDAFSRIYTRWEVTSEISRFILNSSINPPERTSKFEWKSVSPALDFESLESLLDLFVERFQSLGGPDIGVSLSRYITYGHYIYQHIFSVDKLSSVAERIKYEIQHHLDIINPRHPNERSDVISNFNDLKVVKKQGAFISDYINLDMLLSPSSETPETEIIQSTPDDFADFGDVRKASEKIRIETSLSYTDFRYLDTIEQRSLNLILNVYNGFGVAESSHVSIDHAINYMGSLPDDAFIACFYTLLEHLRAEKVSGLEVKSLLRYFGQKLLTSYRFQSSPSALILFSRFSVIYLNCLLTNGSEELINDSSDILNWYLDLARKGELCEEYSLSFFAGSLISLLKDSNAFQIGGIPETYKLITDLLRNSSNYVKVRVSKNVKIYLDSLGWNQKFKFFQDFIGYFNCPESASETSASLLLCLKNFSSYSYPFFMKSLTLVFKNFHFPHFEHYSTTILRDLLDAYHTDDLYELSSIPLLELLTFWFREKKDFSGFPFQLLGYRSLIEFYNGEAILLYAISNSRRKSSRDLISSTIGKDQDELDYDSIPLMIPLSFTEDGIRGEIYSRLLERYSNSSVADDHMLLIVSWFIQLVDVSSERDFVKHIPRFEGCSPEIRNLVSETSPDLYSSLFLKIKLSDALHEISRICSNDKDFWSPAAVSFLNNVLLGLLKRCLTTEEKLLILRRLKLLMILGCDCYKSEELLLDFVQFLSPYLRDKDLHNDVAKMVVTALKQYPGDVIKSKLYPNTIIRLFHEFTEFREGGGSVSSSILELLNSWYHSIGKKDGLKALFSVYNDVLHSNTIRMDSKLLNSLIMESSSSYNMHDIIVNVLSLLFSRETQLSKLPPGFNTSKNVADFLLPLSKIDTCHEVKAFISRYLGRYYIETGDSLVIAEEDFERSIEYSIDRHSQNFNFIFSKLIKIKRESDDLQNVTMVNYVLGFALYQYALDPSRVESVINFGKYLAPFSNTLQKLDWSTFKLLNPKSAPVSGLNEAISTREFPSLSTVAWSKRICIGILTELKDSLVLASPLVMYLSSFPDLSLKVMNVLWMFYVRAGSSSSLNMLDSFIRACLLYKDKSKDLDEKRKIILNLCHLIRCAAYEGIKQAVIIYKNFDFQTIYEAAIDLKLHKFALLIFEDFFTTWAPKESRLEDFGESLAQIYQGIGDNDLLYAIPVKPSLDYALNIFNKTENNSWRSVMFNSASFDSSIIYDNDRSSKAHLLESLAANNLHGLSNLVNNDLESADKSSNIYDWYWKLNKWDISPPVNPSNEGEYVYKILKSVKEQIQPSSIQRLCEASMTDLLTKVNTNPCLLRTLAVLYTIEEASSLSSVELNSNITDYIQSTEKWFDVVPFSSFENLMLSRKVVFENIRIRPDESLFAVSHELSMYGKYARFHNENQKSINASIQLDSLLKTVDQQEDLKPILSKLTSFESASTLWKLHETVIPIAMLTDCLNKRSNYTNINLPLHVVQLPDSVIHSYLIKWNSESKQKRFEQIMRDHVEPAINKINTVPTNQSKAEVYHEIGYFCYKQLKSFGFEENIHAKRRTLESMRSQFKELTEMIKNKSLGEKERKNAKTHAKRLQLQYEADKEIHESLVQNKEACLEKAIIFFLKALSTDDKFDEEDVDKFCALWLEYNHQESVNQTVAQEIFNVPVHKFIPWINQLASHLASDDSNFQTNLQKILLDMSIKHPFHSLYHIMNLRVQSSYETLRADKAVSSRAAAANMIWHSMAKTSDDFKNNILTPIDEFTQHSIDFANEKYKAPGKTIQLNSLKIGDFWLNKLSTFNVPLPTMNDIPISLDLNYDSLPRITKIDPLVVISSSGISLPKIITAVLSDGSSHKFLLKGGSDDLRQDAIMEQVFTKVNRILAVDKESRKTKLRIRTYKVVPLGPIAGMIEFVADSIALGDILRPLHRNDKIGFDEARAMMKESQTKSKRERLAVFNKIIKDIPPAFRIFFYETFLNVDDWYKSRLIYSRGLATTSIVGHVLGLGDRHLNNILIDQKYGEPVHIDLGVAFDQGKLLPIPETVPFRLSRDLVDGLGVSGVKGSFEKGCENVYRVLRDNSERIIGILNVLRHDPLYNWAISPVRKRKLQDIGEEGRQTVEADDADRAVNGVKEKLISNGLSIEATVQQLIQEATDVENLGLIYLGWAPFY